MRLAGNGIGDEEARALGEALKTNTTLTKLSLGGSQKTTRKYNESKASTTAPGVVGRERD